jgi:hypothetical protein
MPIGMLKGIRKNIIEKYKVEKERTRTENIQYDSNLKFQDKKFIDKKIKKDKGNHFLKNKYKYEGMKSKPIGLFKNGVLKLTKRDVAKIKATK